jgi:phospho-N-acetylmuramoyl-pentapeptide-transferase
MGDTGAMALGMTLGVVAFLTNTIVVLPIITLVFTIEGLSFIVQFLSKKLRGGKKIFLSSPLHHHFEAIGWPEYKITMRFWIIGAISALAGLVIAIFGRGDFI